MAQSKPLKRKKPPMQPIGVNDDGVVRFQANEVVHALLGAAVARGFSLSELARDACDAPRGDWEQFNQLIGYSVSGFGDLSSSRRQTINKADVRADRVWRAHKAAKVKE